MIIFCQDDKEKVHNLLIQLKRSRKPGKKECRRIYQKILKAQRGDVQATLVHLFKNLGTGEGTGYILSHVDGDLASWWECFAKKWLSFIYFRSEIRAFAWSFHFIKAIIKSSLHYVDIVKDVRFIILILIPLLPASLHLIILAITALILSEAVKMVQFYFIQKRRSPLLSPAFAYFVHHDEFMDEIQLQYLASIPNRDDDQEQTFAEARRQQRQTDLIKAELRATENVIEHLLQIIVSLSVLTLDGANSQLKMTEGNRLFFFLSLTLSVLSIVRGQVSLISARKNGHLGTFAKLILAVYQIFAILPRIHAMVLLFNGVSSSISLPILGLVAILHILLSCAIQKILFIEEKNLFWQALWTFLTPPLFLDWDRLYRQQDYRISIKECWSRTKYCIFIHHTLTLLGNIAMDRIGGFGWTQLLSTEIDNVIKLVILVCCPVISIGLSFIYFKRRHPWAKLLNAELTNCMKVTQRKCKSDIILPKKTRVERSRIKYTKSAL